MTNSPPPAVELRGISKQYSRRDVLRQLTLVIDPDEYLAVLGVSGCGKTTLLEIIAGLVPPDAGTVWIGGRDITQVSPRKRNVSLLFQSDALYPHMNVRRNIELGALAMDTSSTAKDDRVEEAAEMVGIHPLLDRSPDRLSGGERRRVALAKAIARRAAVRLLDEPLSAVDAHLRFQIQDDLVRWHQCHPGVTIHVTHDGIEAMRMADRIAVIDDGRIVQVATPQTLYAQPATPAVAHAVSTSPCNVVHFSREPHAQAITLKTVQIQWMEKSLPDAVGFRATDCQMMTDADSLQNGLLLSAPVEALRSVDSFHYATLDAGDQRLFALVPPHLIAQAEHSLRDPRVRCRWHIRPQDLMRFETQHVCS
ncbi:ABC transporter ATP-binding protein [Stieleria varia]|uniref:Spermidine/putrescine import ATP-binding protein PotA n=1 Tax=Stieleria varia TaxID=2528005 RepID=A0A5C6B6L4_9BACT|nr:ABC transporter ATP-binding protein [Stieleria varia]TWU07703.1 Spermidine/putrescine import ATP-binding protein PotA [Stieleria varia]